MHASVVLESSAVQAYLLTQSGDSFSVVVGEDVELEDAFCNVGSTHEIDFEELSLEVTLIWSVLFQGLQKESSGLLDSGVFQEHLDYTVNGNLGDVASVSVGDHLGKSDSSFRIDGHNVSEDLDEVWRVVGLLAVRHDFVVLVCLNQGLDDLVWSVRSGVDQQSQLGVVLSDEVSELVSEAQFILLNPLLYELHFPLSQHWL